MQTCGLQVAYVAVCVAATVSIIALARPVIDTTIMAFPIAEGSENSPVEDLDL